MTQNSEQIYDFFVIGAGSAGVRFARMAAAKGYKVALAEEYRYGGTCVIRGCVPKKLYAYAARSSDYFKLASGYGWTHEQPVFSWQTLQANKAKEIDRLEGVYENLLLKSGVHIVKERAVFLDQNTLELVQSKTVIKADKIIIATGAKPRILEKQGQKIGLTSNEIFNLPHLPKEIFIYGGGYIALEFACIFAGLGVQVALGYRGNSILGSFDTDIQNHMTDLLKNYRHMQLFPNLDMKAFDISKKNLEAGISFDYQGQHYDFDMMMNATGRVPYTDELGLEKCGVRTEKNGAICVDAYSQTNIANIYALGDVTNRMALTPIAIAEAMCLLKTVCDNTPTAMTYEQIPTAVFTSPEIGTIGFTASELDKQGIAYDVYESHFKAMKYAFLENPPKTYLKMLVCQKTDKVLGCHMIADDASEVIQILGVVVGAGLTKADFDKTIAVHPTIAEEWVLMRTKKTIN